MLISRYWSLYAFALFSTVCTLTVHAQGNPQPPYALFEQSTLTGSGNTIKATQLPVVVSPGVVVYLNLTIQFNVDANGNLTLSAGFPQAVTAPPLTTASFTAGRYVGPTTILSGKSVIA